MKVLKDAWLYFTVMSAAGAALIAGTALTTRGPFMRGLIVGAGSALLLGGLADMLIMVSGTAATGMGAIAEQWTVSELRPLKKQGWRMVNHFLLRRHDIDHVLVGPDGVMAVETKWSGDGWELSPPSSRVLDAIRRIKQNAHDLEMWHFVRRHGTPTVRPVLFLWTASDVSTPEPGSPIMVDGVAILTGVKSAAKWRASLTSGTATLTDEQVDGIWSAFENQAQTRDDLEAVERDAPMSYSGMLWNLLGVVIAMFASLWVTSLTARAHAWAFLALQLALVAAGLAARRVSTLRIPSLGWIVPAVSGVALATWSVIEHMS